MGGKQVVSYDAPVVKTPPSLPTKEDGLQDLPHLMPEWTATTTTCLPADSYGRLGRIHVVVVHAGERSAVAVTDSIVELELIQGSGERWRRCGVAGGWWCPSSVVSPPLYSLPWLPVVAC